jgi:N-acetylneuraminic acid mutarotase
MLATRVNRLLISASVAVVLLAGCKGHGSGTAPLPAVDTNWSWQAGTEVSGNLGNFISIGSSTTTGMPSGRVGAQTWLDHSGKFWVFSGLGGASDLWSFNTSSLQWTWQNGTATITLVSPGVYVATATNPAVPGQRSSGATWTDASGKLWLFGGYGVDGNGLTGYMNDMWTYTPQANVWTTSSTAGVTPSSSSQPNPRSNSAFWTSGCESGGTNCTFYMFGGQGYVGLNSGVQNDLWKYDVSTNQWSMIGGVSTLNPTGSYGPKSTYVNGNIPGGRQSATTWTDSAGTIWMFGGIGIDSVGANGYLNDLWQYVPATNEWIWMNGGVTINNLGAYGTNGVAASSNQPGGRSGSIGWIDGSNNLWLFGGYGINYDGGLVVLNDLWEYVYATQQWVWINGSYYGNTTGVYGTLGAMSQYNTPGARFGASAWQDSAGYFWMFGGSGYDALGTNGRLNDVWRYFP